MSTDVLFLEFLLLKNMLPSRLDYITRLDEYYFNDNPQEPVSTDSIEGLDGLEACEVVITKDTVFKAGMLMSCEPAIYIAEEGFGIRLENDILVTKDGQIDLLADEPIEIDDIEKLMRK